MGDALYERKLFTPYCIDSIYLGVLYDEEQALVIPALLEAADSYAAHSERILLTPYCIYSILLLLL